MSLEVAAVAIRPVVAIMAAAILVTCVQAADSATLPLVRTWAAADRLAPVTSSPAVEPGQWLAGPPGVRARERGVGLWEPSPCTRLPQLQCGVWRG